ncbi:hypothetical protein RchiOBHm_Chr3g0488131 [Rosa chinensis]|uniref:Uncharacterized protein n=1 Tax=Rosa chinensis TaxID=74649 RepID=A0A2P6RFQ4_ROSCH|nr:hypothetical protein RchiOBHm_Chr3g0488131 [Rosa chinensis]
MNLKYFNIYYHTHTHTCRTKVKVVHLILYFMLPFLNRENVLPLFNREEVKDPKRVSPRASTEERCEGKEQPYTVMKKESICLNI